MRVYQRILLVAVLAAVFVAAGVAAVRMCLSPLGDQAARTPRSGDETEDELPAACRNELAAMDNAPAAEALPESRTAGRGNVLRPETELAAGGADHRFASEDVSQAPAQLPRGSDDGARPIGSFNSEPAASKAQSAEWNAQGGRTAAVASQSLPPRTVTLPVSVESDVPSGALASLKGADVLELMRRLRSDGETEKAARRELVRHGFSEVDLELARQLFSPDVADRKRLAQTLPRLASVDAPKWLLWLAADPQPEVRRAAITTLATTGDPGLLDRAEALARKDSDEQIQALADQIAKQRDLAVHPGGGNSLR
jgi:hypothetical protein